MDQQNYYAELEVDKYATKQQIADAYSPVQSRYRRLALKWHPKLCKEDLNTCYRNFCRVSEAYEVLHDSIPVGYPEEKKAIYDQYGEHRLKEGIYHEGNWKGGYRFSGNPEDIFEKFFGSRNPYDPLFDRESNKEAKSVFSSLYPQAQHEQLKDLVVKAECTLTELYNGCLKNLSYTRQVLNKDARSTSNVVKEKEVEIKPGMSPQTIITFTEQGHEQAGVPSSNLVIEIVEVPEKGFVREGNNLVYTAQMTLLDALDSKPIKITTLDNRVISVPLDQIANPKTAVEIPGEGMPIYSEYPTTSKAKRGDLTVRMNIQFPIELSEWQKKELTEILADP